MNLMLSSMSFDGDFRCYPDRQLRTRQSPSTPVPPRKWMKPPLGFSFLPLCLRELPRGGWQMRDSPKSPRNTRRFPSICRRRSRNNRRSWIRDVNRSTRTWWARQRPCRGTTTRTLHVGERVTCKRYIKGCDKLTFSQNVFGSPLYLVRLLYARETTLKTLYCSHKLLLKRALTKLEKHPVV